MLLAVALFAPAGASADRAAELSVMDDQLLLGASQANVDRDMGIFVALGADRLRVSAFWNQLAPSPKSRTKPTGFDGKNHLDPRYAWAPLDRVVAVR